MASHFNEKVAAGRKRGMDTLRRKFKGLKNALKPTGDPTISKDVKRAKFIQRDIEAGMGVAKFNSNEKTNEQ